MVRQRHVFYIAGYDPQGVSGYYRLFRRELSRFMRLWPVNVSLSDPKIDEDGILGRWQIKTVGPNWCVDTTYEFLRWEDIVARDLRRPLLVLVPRVLHCFLENLLNGTTFRIFCVGWRFGVFYVVQSIALILIVPASVVAGWLTYLLADHAMGPSGLAPLAAGVTAGGLAVALARYLCDRWYIIQLCNAWLWFHDWAHGRRADFLARVDEFARRIVAKARAGDCDELLVIGHSGGGQTAILVIARALEIDPDFARIGSPVVLAVLGSSLPVAALHPLAHDVREAIRRLAVEPSLAWIDCQARKDVCNFQNCDMVKGLGVDAGPQQCNPLYWNVRLRDVVSPQIYRRLRCNFFRMHFQFIMANDQRASYDYFMFVCGPIRLLDWAKDTSTTLACIAQDARYTLGVAELATHTADRGMAERQTAVDARSLPVDFPNTPSWDGNQRTKPPLPRLANQPPS